MKKYKYMLVDEDGKVRVKTRTKYAAEELKRHYKNNLFGVKVEIKDIEE